jgi:hypothetical protein
VAACAADQEVAQTPTELDDNDGHGRYGMFDEPGDGLVCHECGHAFPTSACTPGEATASNDAAAPSPSS